MKGELCDVQKREELFSNAGRRGKGFHLSADRISPIFHLKSASAHHWLCANTAGKMSVLMAQLPLHRRYIAGFLHNEHPHPVSGRMRCFVIIHAGKIPDLIPHRIYHFRVQPAITVGIRI